MSYQKTAKLLEKNNPQTKKNHKKNPNKILILGALPLTQHKPGKKRQYTCVCVKNITKM